MKRFKYRTLRTALYWPLMIVLVVTTTKAFQSEAPWQLLAVLLGLWAGLFAWALYATFSNWDENRQRYLEEEEMIEREVKEWLKRENPPPS